MKEQLQGHRDLECWRTAMKLVVEIYRITRIFVGNSIRSLLEGETQLEIARDLGYLSAERATDLLRDTLRHTQLLNGLRAWSEKQIQAEG